ncbi:hypothetical protein ASPWEDRAFT_171134 [Aspergillus wentii DTO 134E9]|uniref:Uncharacterized protein n=1 Tax=Aspergillus wentii DTO 134E9 TaxID=1073089 RepID=A0A1L9RRW1_ASPWE|nr:uncharacterized protein ASPWEDRAFT_171134 [Aspergillus wentii DTO 134E9]KAI9930506.1 hypothetical protein MW887_011260 [Aspergillus wentii]OJJ37665.1 hypothetical protein ASPWEDRAFT_171134 [Aspergillus wentii DTO 134E9]
MPASEYAPQLNYLRDSANSLGSLSPSTAAYLHMVHNRILLDEFKPLNQRHQEFSCGACGSIRKPECTKTIEIKKKKTKRSNKPASSSSVSREGATVYKCLRCHRRTVKPHRKEAVRSNTSSRSTAAASSTPDIQPSTSTAGTSAEKNLSQPASDVDATKVTKTVENASSKKRAKARKQGGLQALLASKQQSKSNSSLDLFDFMQQ